MLPPPRLPCLLPVPLAPCIAMPPHCWANALSTKCCPRIAGITGGAAVAHTPVRARAAAGITGAPWDGGAGAVATRAAQAWAYAGDGGGATSVATARPPAWAPWADACWITDDAGSGGVLADAAAPVLSVIKLFPVLALHAALVHQKVGFVNYLFRC